MNPDDSRPLDGSETIETMRLDAVIAGYKEHSLGIVHGDRYTWVHGWSTTGNDLSKNPLMLLTDCYGDEIPGTLGTRSAPLRVVVRN